MSSIDDAPQPTRDVQDATHGRAHFEQEVTERTENGSNLCCLRFLLFKIWMLLVADKGSASLRPNSPLLHDLLAAKFPMQYSLSGLW